MDEEREDPRTAPRDADETNQTVKFWDPPEVMRKVVIWAIAVALLLLGIGIVVLLLLTRGSGDTAQGGTHSPPTAVSAPVGTPPASRP